MTQRWQRLDIQGLRALALLIIFVYHARIPWHGAYVALDVFFVISGFVITQMLVRERQSTGRIAFRRFYARRFRRLTPALAVMVGIVVLASIVIQSPLGDQQTTGQTAIGAMLFTANVVIAKTTGSYFDSPAEHNPLLHTWSLSVEEQFYFVFPALMALGWWLTRRYGRRLLQPLSLLIGLWIGTFVFAVVTTSGPLAWPATAFTGYYGGLGRAWEFASGAILALTIHRIEPVLTARISGLLSWGGFVLIMWAAFTYSSATPYPGVATLAPILGTAGMIAGGTYHHGSFSRLMSTAPMVRIGDMSYSWYLWHWPLVVFAVILWPSRPILAPMIAIAASFIPAYASYRLLEMPLRSIKTMQVRRMSLLVVGCFGVPLALAALLIGGASRTWGVEWPRLYDYRDAAAYVRGCHDQLPDPSRCRWAVGDAAAAGGVAVVGDSQALSLSDGVIDAATSLSLPVFESSASQCPFIAPGYVRFDYANDFCDRWQQSIVPTVLDARPEVVVIANRPYAFGETGGVSLVDPTGQGRDDATLWQEALGAVVGQLRDAGIGVVLAEPPPESTYDTPAAGLLQVGRARTTLAEAERARERTLPLDEAVASAHPGTVLFDPQPWLCDEGICPDVADGDFLYADAHHLSVPGSKRLAGPLVTAIETAMPSR